MVDIRDRSRWVAAVDEVRNSLDPRDNIWVDYSTALHCQTVMVGSVMVYHCTDRAEALGYARRLADGCPAE